MTVPSSPIQIVVVREENPADHVTVQTTSAAQVITNEVRSNIDVHTQIGVKGDAGPEGPAGLPGPPGPAGANGALGDAALAYTHTQNAVSDTWTVAHELGFRPSVSIFDSAGTEIEGDIVHNDTSNLTLRFTSAFAGTVYLS